MNKMIGRNLYALLVLIPGIMLVSFQLANVYEREVIFPLRGKSLTDSIQTVLTDVSAFYKSKKSAKIEIHCHPGYRDPKWSERPLGYRRAESVKKFLVESGISWEYITVISDERFTLPIVKRKYDTGDSLSNRTIQIKLYYIPE